MKYPLGINVNNHLAGIAMAAMLPQVDALPGAQGQAAVEHGDGEGGGGERRFNMGRHVIAAFQRVGIVGIILAHQPVEPSFQIVAGGRVGILLDEQACRGMADEQAT